MADTLLRTGTYTPQDGEEGKEFRTQFFPDGSAIIVNEKGVFLVERRVPYLFSPRPAEQASAIPDQDISDQASLGATC